MNTKCAGLRFRNTTSRGSFGDALAEMDDSIGQIISSLHANGIQNDTLVFFTSDNGPNLNRLESGCAGALRCGKGSTYEGGMRVPALAYWPGKVRPGKERGLLTALDLAPTFAALANIAWRPPGGHGSDQGALLLGQGDVIVQEGAECLLTLNFAV